MAVPDGVYHTALKGGRQEAAPPVSRWVSPTGDVALAWDIAKGIPGAAYRCDVVYAEIPWPSGYQEFNRRAGAKNSAPFNVFVAAIARITSTLARRGVPVYMVASNALAERLGSESLTPINFNKGVSKVHCKGPLKVKPKELEPVGDLLDRLAQEHGRVWDFCCGYGRTGKHFTATGKHWVLSDINPTCIGYIAQTAGEWP